MRSLLVLLAIVLTLYAQGHGVQGADHGDASVTALSGDMACCEDMADGGTMSCLSCAVIAVVQVPSPGLIFSRSTTRPAHHIAPGRLPVPIPEPPRGV